MNNTPCIIFAIDGNPFLVYIQRGSDINCSTRNEWIYVSRYLSLCFWESHIKWATLWGSSNALLSTVTCFSTHQSSLLWYFCSSSQNFKIVSRLARMPSHCQMVFWDSGLYLDPPPPITLCWRVQSTNTQFDGVDISCSCCQCWVCC